MTKKNITNILELSCVILIFIIVCFIYKDQKPMTFNQGKGEDGYYYFEGIKQIKEGQSNIVGVPPFINRLGFLGSIALYSRISKQNILESSFQFNLIGSFFTVILLIFWLRHFITRIKIRILLATIFMFAWHVPIRHLYFDIIVPDTWGAAFFIASLLFLWKIKRCLCQKKATRLIIIFSIFISIASAFRESNLIVGIALFFINNPFKAMNLNLNSFYPQNILTTSKNIFLYYKNPKNILLFLPIVLTILVSSFCSQFVIINNINGYSYIKALVQWFYDKSFVEYATAIFISYGPIVTLIPFYYSDFKTFFRNKEELLFILASTFLIGYIAGGDTERILFMSSFPIVFILVGISIEKIFVTPKRWWLFVVLTLQSFALRVFWNLPDYPNNIDNTPIPFFGLIGNQFQYLLLYSYHGNRNINTLILLEYLILIFITWLILRKGDKVKINTSYRC